MVEPFGAGGYVVRNEDSGNDYPLAQEDDTAQGIAETVFGREVVLGVHTVPAPDNENRQAEATEPMQKGPDAATLAIAHNGHFADGTPRQPLG